MATPPKIFLFLQGPPNGYWSRLARALQDAGQRVQKIQFCLADQVFWCGVRAQKYRGSFANWSGWLADYVVKYGVTDIVYYADQQPYHRAARKVAKALNIKCWAIEFGYLRPDWLTLERSGMGPISHFPSDRVAISALAAKHQEPDMRCIYPHKFMQEAVGEVIFHLLQTLGRPLFPLFKADKTYWPVVDYLAWLPELFREKKQKTNADHVVEQITKSGASFWLVALQIHADYQIRSHSPFDHQEQMLKKIFESFAENTQSGILVVKIHPLDNGLENWPKRVGKLVAQYGLAGRVNLIKGGDLGFLIRRSKGVIIANSTVGLHSIFAGVPTIALGRALFDIDGLTHRTGLSEFWGKPDFPDAKFAGLYRRALCEIQVKGSFYNKAGRECAIVQMVDRLIKSARPAKKPLRQVAEPSIIAAE